MNTIRWGILGAASIAGKVAPAIQASRNGTLAAVASRSLQKAEAFGKPLGALHCFGSYEEMLASGTIDAIYLPLPNTLHVPWILRCLDAGLPVLCEKPLALSRGEAQRVVDRAALAGLPVAEGYMYRFHPQFEALKSLLRSGAIGDVTSLSATFTFLEDNPDSIVASAKLGGGALTDIGGYCLDFFCQTLGEVPLRVRALSVGSPVDETVMGSLEFPGAVLARFEASIRSGERHDAAVHGTTGSIHLDNPWVAGEGETSLTLRRYGAPDEQHVVKGENCYRLEVEDFADAVLGVSRLRFGPEHIVRMATLLEQVRGE